MLASCTKPRPCPRPQRLPQRMIPDRQTVSRQTSLLSLVQGPTMAVRCGALVLGARRWMQRSAQAQPCVLLLLLLLLLDRPSSQFVRAVWMESPAEQTARAAVVGCAVARARLCVRRPGPRCDRRVGERGEREAGRCAGRQWPRRDGSCRTSPACGRVAGWLAGWHRPPHPVPGSSILGALGSARAGLGWALRHVGQQDDEGSTRERGRERERKRKPAHMHRPVPAGHAADASSSAYLYIVGSANANANANAPTSMSLRSTPTRHARTSLHCTAHG